MPDLISLSKTFNNLGVALRKARRYDQSIKVLEKASAAHPYDPNIVRNLAVAYRGAERYQEAIPAYLQAIELGKSEPDLLFDLAACYEKLGNTEMAIATYERYIRDTKKTDPEAAKRARGTIDRLSKK